MEFLGSSNLFEGKVAKIVGDRMEVQASALRATVPVNPLRPFAIGDDVTFVVPENRIRIAADSGEPFENSIAANIIGEEFVGATVRLYVDAGRAQEVRVLTSYGPQSESISGLRCRVALFWSSSDAYVHSRTPIEHEKGTEITKYQEVELEVGLAMAERPAHAYFVPEVAGQCGIVLPGTAIASRLPTPCGRNIGGDREKVS